MSSSNSKPYSRRRQERREKERRAVDYPFGSPEWLAWVQQEHFLWPKHDRRRGDRRVEDRRKKSNHANHYNGTRSKPLNNLLSEEEKRMIADLMRQNHSD